MSRQLYSSFKIGRKVCCLKKLPCWSSWICMWNSQVKIFLHTWPKSEGGIPVALWIDFIYKFRLSSHLCNKQDQDFLTFVDGSFFKTLLYWRHNGKGHKETNRDLTACRAHLTWILTKCVEWSSMFSGIFSYSLLFDKGNKEGHSVPTKIGR